MKKTRFSAILSGKCRLLSAQRLLKDVLACWSLSRKLLGSMRNREYASLYYMYEYSLPYVRARNLFVRWGTLCLRRIKWHVLNIIFIYMWLNRVGITNFVRLKLVFAGAKNSFLEVNIFCIFSEYIPNIREMLKSGNFDTW